MTIEVKVSQGIMFDLPSNKFSYSLFKGPIIKLVIEK